MPTVWYAILAGLLIGYAILDGFDLGAGMLHLLVARTDRERRMVLNAIGPVWNGNEVWLIVWGGLLFLAFPRAYAVGFSGFYLALVIVLWLLMGRGIAIELRHHIASPLWQGACDVVFAISSLLLALLFGVAVGNVISGVPLNEQGYFQGLFEWMLNPYALLMGVFSVTILALHAANYLAAKTTGMVQQRAQSLGAVLWYPTAGLVLALGVATFMVHPLMARNFHTAPMLLILPLVALCLLALMWYVLRRQAAGWSFLVSSGLIATLLGVAAVGLYPYLLPSSTDPARGLTIDNAAAGPASLSAGLLWIVPGLILLAAYEVFLYRTFKGRIFAEGEA
jgi:cytochrome d ubiquinol oxidase subunit II